MGVTSLLAVRGVVVYLIVGLLVFAEDAVFVGFVLPGETAAILGGAAAARGHVSLTVMCAVVVVGAIVGDSIGYEVGARYGTRVLSLRMVRRRAERVNAARGRLALRGGPAVFGGRFVAFLRPARRSSGRDRAGRMEHPPAPPGARCAVGQWRGHRGAPAVSQVTLSRRTAGRSTVDR